MMTSNELARSLPALFAELVYGPPQTGAFVLNRGDVGLLATVETLSSEDASQAHEGRATIAAHVDHLRYGLSLMNRWAGGENPFADANWAKSWDFTAVTETEWSRLREQLQAEVVRWHAALQSLQEVTGAELDGVIASIAHLAYHLGAIRQIHPSALGPRAND
jgi:hypothetical protein